MTQTISFLSGKGGVGKTFLTAAFSVYLARNGAHVLAVDGDMGLRNLDIPFGKSSSMAYNIWDLAQGKCFPNEAVLPVMKGLDFLPAPEEENWRDVSRSAVDTVFDDLISAYDYVLIDCPAGMGKGIRFAKARSDRFILVVTPSQGSLRDGLRMRALLGEDAQCRFLLNRFLEDSPISFLDALSLVGTEEFGGVLPEAAKTVKLSEEGRMMEFDGHGYFGNALDMCAKSILGKAWYPRSAWMDLLALVGKERKAEVLGEKPAPPVTRLLRRRMSGQWKWKGR